MPVLQQRVARRMTTAKWVITARTEKFAPFTKSHTATTTCAAWAMAVCTPESNRRITQEGFVLVSFLNRLF